MQVVILASGRGERFLQKGFNVPKPLILANGKPMIHHALEQAATLTSKPIVVCPEVIRHEIWHNAPSHVVPLAIGVRYVQSGAAMSLLAAAGALDEDQPIITMDCDSIIDHRVIQMFGYWSERAFEHAKQSTIMSFIPADDSARYSFVRMAAAHTEGEPFPSVVEVVEKVRISSVATCGVHAFKSWRVLREAVCEMVHKRNLKNGEYYMAPVHNYVDNTTALCVGEQAFTAIGTPEQLEEYERSVSQAR